jgi:hypothetical protein
MRAFRSLLVFKLGVWAGMVIAAAFVKRAVPSHGDEDSDELSLVAVFHGIDLTEARCWPGSAASKSTYARRSAVGGKAAAAAAEI